jgi:hypothetical protein
MDWGRSTVILRSHPGTDTAATLKLATGEDGNQLTAFVPVLGANGRTLWFLLDSGDIEGTIVSAQALADQSIVVGRDSMIAVRGTAGVARLRITPKAISYDGVLGTAYLLTGPLVIDLRGVVR